jgi:GNAT superfamily N-acetyltransferase
MLTAAEARILRGDDMYCWRPARSGDIPQIAHISSVALAGYPEEEAVFVEMLALSPDGCFVLEMDGRISGYLVGHPWMRETPPPLNTTLGALPPRADSWYLHDLSLLPAARGHGAARAAVEIAVRCARAHNLGNVSLVAVNNAGPFWEAQGFTAHMPRAVADRLASYGTDALYMERDVAG